MHLVPGTHPVPADWGTAVVVDPGVLRTLQHENARLRMRARWTGRGFCLLLVTTVVCGAAFRSSATRADGFAQGLRHCRKSAQRSSRVLATLARSHEDVLTATEQTPSVGTKSWGRRFSVTMYTPRNPKYGKFNDGLTATLTKADPNSRIVAVDPKLIPYGSWVWVEDLGWFHAEDCGADIKGFRLDLLAATEAQARDFGRQERFAMVVPGAA
jgi:3D (Asp-Asp-Asp) domain-containing protein